MTFEQFLFPISKKNPEGEFLRFDPLYDQIKEARRFEDEDLSQGVWQIEKKRADWQLVRKLCEEVLLKKSKDLQVVSWYTESLSHTEGLVGLAYGLNLISELCNNFWDSIHPQNDLEYRIRIFEWLSNMVHEQLIMCKITSDIQTIDLKPITYNDWIWATKLEALAKRPGQDLKFLQDNAESNGRKIMPNIKKALDQTPVNYFEELKLEIANIKDAIDNLKEVLNKFDASPSFSQSMDVIKGILRIISPFLTKNIPNEVAQTNEIQQNFIEAPKNDDAVAISSKEDAYALLNELGALLKQVDPHSPSSSIIELLVSWKDKTLIQLINDIETGDSEAHKLLKMFSK